MMKNKWNSGYTKNTNNRLSTFCLFLSRYIYIRCLKKIDI